MAETAVYETTAKLEQLN